MRLALAFLLLALAACDTSDSDITLLRVENATEIDFSSVAIGSPGQEVTWGTVPAGSVSEYREVEELSTRTNIVAEAADGLYSHIPMHDSPFGEPLGRGRYTFLLDVDGSIIELDIERD